MKTLFNGLQKFVALQMVVLLVIMPFTELILLILKL